MLLAGDIGGTKTDLAIVSEDSGPKIPVALDEFHNASYPNLEAIVREFLQRTAHRVEHAYFCIAGPVMGDTVKATNLPWVISAEKLTRELSLQSVHLLNDLEATALAIPLLKEEDLHTLNVGRAMPGGAIAVIAPGTGLGEAFLTWNGAAYVAQSSEGGHADFAPKDSTQMGLLQYLQRRHDHVSFELVCSGIGIPNIYHYLRDTASAPESPALAKRLAEADDPTPIIVENGLAADNSCKLCTTTLDIFASVLAAEAGNLALKVLATGGVYLAGGIPKRILPALDSVRFMTTFTRKGRVSDLLTQIPIHVVISRAALIGVARFGLEREHTEEKLKANASRQPG